MIEFVRFPSPAISVFPEIGVYSSLSLPLQDHMWNVLNGPVGQHFLAAMERGPGRRRLF